jgi:zinc transport system substrate-binding protein
MRVIFISVFSISVFLGCSLQAKEPVRVAVSILPLLSIVEELGGDWVEARSLQEGGDSCSVFEPRPSVLHWVSEAELFVRVGVAYETSLLPRLERQNPALQFIDLRHGEALLAQETAHAHHHAEGEACSGCGHGMEDPHIWLDPAILQRQVSRMADQLVQLRPEASKDIRAREAKLKRELVALDADLKALLANYSGRSFLVFHPSLSYFANAYGLKQMSIQGSGGTSVRELRAVISKAREAGIRTVFVQPQESTSEAQVVASAINGSLQEIDPLAEHLLKNLRTIGVLLANSFSIEG